MDPLESVVTIWSRRLGGDQRQDQQVLGATLCLWHDRAVAREEDQLTMNPVYPGMLAFAERAWLGGGQSKWTATLPAAGSAEAAAFEAFEERLLAHRTCFFAGEALAYVSQSNLSWKLYGPFNNGGNLTQTFAPERPGFDSATKPALTARGATVVLRHWWAPAITGVLPQPQENTTWYATTTLWSPVAGYKPFWIGFNNMSRSPATNSPPAGAWNTLQSALWVNGKLVQPPLWTRAGQRGHSEIPLTDEGYEYRPPTMLWLYAGWNTVLVKLPIGSFKAPDWQNPVKWMFTFCEAPNGYYPAH
jgi:hypothetical protein